MPIKFLDRPDCGYFEVCWIGKLCGDELIPSYRSFFEGGDWQPGKPELSNASQADLSGISPENLEELLGYTEQVYEHHGVSEARCAIWAPNDLPFGLGRMYAALAQDSPEEVQVFRNRDEAVAWLTLGEAESS